MARLASGVNLGNGGTVTGDLTVTGTLKGGILANSSVQYSTSASNLTINDNVNAFILEPASTTVAQTVTMPANPVDGQELSICGGSTSGGVVTTLTLSANSGQTIVGAIVTLALGGFARYRYRATNTRWYRCG